MDIKYITLWVYSIDSEVTFCTGKLGFQILKRTMFLNDVQSVVLIKQNGSMSLLLLECDKDNALKNTVILNSDDFLKDHFELKGHGVSFLTEPEYTNSGLTASFMDPCGNKWILIEERDYSFQL